MTKEQLYWYQTMYQSIILGKHTMKPIYLKLGTLDTIAFNKKTLKTTLLYRNFTDFETFETTSNKKDFVDFRVGFLLAWLKKHLSNDEFRTLIGQLFYKGKPQITFLRGYALRYFDSLRQMDKFLEAIKNEQDQVNIGGEIIKIVWKG